jgi:hypothetical protein
MTAMTDLAVPLITAAAAPAGAVVGQASTIVNTVVTGRRDRTAREAAGVVKTVVSGIQSELTEARRSPPERVGRAWPSRALRDACDDFVEVARKELN